MLHSAKVKISISQCKHDPLILSLVPNPKFEVWEETELRGSFYSSDNKELSISDKQRFCELLNIPFDST